MAELGEYAQGWRPEEGDRIAGKITELSMGYSEFRNANTGYPILTLVQDDGEEIAVHCFHTVLENRVRELKPVPGERIEILFKGEKPTKDGRRTMKVYAVRVLGRTQADFWDDTPARAPAQTATQQPATAAWDDSDDIPF